MRKTIRIGLLSMLCGFIWIEASAAHLPRIANASRPVQYTKPIPYATPDELKSAIFQSFGEFCGPGTATDFVRDEGIYYGYFASSQRFVLAFFGPVHPAIQGAPQYLWFGHFQDGKFVVDVSERYDETKHQAGPCPWLKP